MKQILKAFCKELQIDHVGIANVGPYKELEEILIKREEKGWLTGFEEGDIAKRIDPSLTMEGVQSVIVCLFPYHVEHKEKSNLSNYTYSKDYHHVVKERLDTIGEFLKNTIPDFEYQAYVDTGPLADRYLAYQAGLGFFGINAHLITDEYGSYVFIGYILNNYPFEFDAPMDRTCYQCMACVHACPGQIILGNFDINPLRCRSFVTQKKRDLDERDMDIINKDIILFGCDICQKVCPHNDGIKETPIEDFKEDLIYKLDHATLEALSNRAFMRSYKDRAFAWRGRKVLKRNYDIIHRLKGEE